MERKINDRKVKDLSKVFGNLKDSTRIKILLLLSEDRMNVGELCEELGGFTQPNMSHHLSLLKNSGLVDSEREGKNNYYFLDEENSEFVVNLLQAISAQVYEEVLPEKKISTSKTKNTKTRKARHAEEVEA